MRYFCRIHIGCPARDLFHTVDRAQRPTLKMNTFMKWQAADAELHGLPGGSSALNATKKKMSRENVTRRDAERRDIVMGHTANLATMSRKRPMTCFLCGEEITRNINNTKGKKNKNACIRQCIAKDNNDCFRRCNAYEGGVRGGEGGDNGRCQRNRYLAEKRKKYTSKTCGQNRCLTDCTLLSE